MKSFEADGQHMTLHTAVDTKLAKPERLWLGRDIIVTTGLDDMVCCTRVTESSFGATQN
ncbi:hypothetical protein DPMN_109724 [Dreissena polymorpha]|uniref:Uncharacterized protein n=1 Tax=Dreissena polymorpha TaxID=45954 RepID=A0A9D4QMG2_DREPO|nr:hypothetical protein DPMN_109724 [Dreissena polymorpha]